MSVVSVSSVPFFGVWFFVVIWGWSVVSVLLLLFVVVLCVGVGVVTVCIHGVVVL